MGDTTFTVKFWGVRGSIADPLTQSGLVKSLYTAKDDYLQFCRRNAGTMLDPNSLKHFLEFVDSKDKPMIHGGNTSCVEILSRAQGAGLSRPRFVCDMGTGVRLLGNSLFPEMRANGGLEIFFLLSHLHWDHIQGIPFFAPLYINKYTGIKNSWHFYGGNNWLPGVQACLAGQMDEPTFPVAWPKISEMTHKITSCNLIDMFTEIINGVRVTARQLNHPQETYGWRLEQDSKIVVYATDHEPYDPLNPDPKLLELVQDADIYVTDCQYSQHSYNGRNEQGEPNKVPAKYGWGHSYPLSVAHTVAKANVKKVVLFHHDPGATAKDIEARVVETKQILQRLGHKCEVVAAWEGLEINV